MAEIIQLIENVWLNSDTGYEWTGELLGAFCEVCDALLAERERAGKLRAVLERIEIMHHHKGAGEAKALAAQALREDGQEQHG